MPGLLSILHRCIHSHFFDIYFSPDIFKFSCSSLGFYLFITLRESSFEINYNCGVIFIKYNVPKSQKFELFPIRDAPWDISWTGNYRDSRAVKYAEVFYKLYYQLVNDYVYPTLSSIKASEIQVKECSEYLIESNIGKLVSYPFLEFYMNDVLHFKTSNYWYNPSTSKIITSMFNELKKFDCTYPRRNIMRFISYAKALL